MTATVDSDRSATREGRLPLAARILWMRLRFVLAVAGLFAVVALWQQFGALWDRAVLWSSGQSAASRGVSPDTEYFCPMCPGVLSAWPEKCPVCKMPLVRRTRGTSQLLPEGVTARMQISPYRLQLAGIKTSLVGYMPLTHEFRARGSVTRDAGETARLAARISPWDIPFASPGAAVEIRSAAHPAGTALAGQIDTVGSDGELHVRLPNPSVELPLGTQVEVVARVPLVSVEPYRSQPRNIPPREPGAKNSYFVCPDHPGWTRSAAGKCPFDDRDLEERTLRDDQRLGWSCRWHDDGRHRDRSEKCSHCQRECRSLQVVTYAPAGEVLVVPSSAVIDTGKLRLVYVETMPGMFDGVVVELGNQEGGYYPVLSGLEPGQRVATAGAFLLDAETQLNPSLAAGYFGAGSTATAGTAPSILAGGSRETSLSPDLLATLGLAPDDLHLARKQKICPITRMPLGSMGAPIRIDVQGEPVFLCCEACRDSVKMPRATP